MKKGGHTLLIVFCCLLCLLAGIFLGRNLNNDRVTLLPNIESTDTNPTQSADSFRLNINTATKLQIQELPGIGEVIAQRIVAYRDVNGPFQRIDDLKNVEGIGEKKLDTIKDLINIGG